MNATIPGETKYPTSSNKDRNHKLVNVFSTDLGKKAKNVEHR